MVAYFEHLLSNARERVGDKRSSEKMAPQADFFEFRLSLVLCCATEGSAVRNKGLVPDTF